MRGSLLGPSLDESRERLALPCITGPVCSAVPSPEERRLLWDIELGRASLPPLEVDYTGVISFEKANLAVWRMLHLLQASTTLVKRVEQKNLNQAARQLREVLTAAGFMPPGEEELPLMPPGPVYPPEPEEELDLHEEQGEHEEEEEEEEEEENV